MGKKIKTTGIGSIPHTNIESGLDYSFRHDLPFLPQFYNIEGSMISVAKNNSYPYLTNFLEMAQKKEVKEIKVQLAGPGSSLLKVDILKQNIDFLASKCEQFKTTLFIDEPIIAKTNDLKRLITHAKEVFHKVGLHCCADITETEIYNELSLDILSYDFTLNPELHKIISPKIKLCLGINIKTSLIPKIKNINLISSSCGLAKSTISESELFLKSYEALKTLSIS